jgi:inhibitor of cysteine peptidase
MFLKSRVPAKLAMLVLALPLALSAGPQGGAAREQKSVRAGTSWVVEMQGNPSTGYKWRLDQAGSENPSIVKVEDLGYGEAKTEGKKLLGAPAPQRFRLTGLSAGFAKLHFEYVQPWVGKPAKTEDIWVHVD